MSPPGSRERFDEVVDRVSARFAALRESSRVVEVGARIYERDRAAGGSLVGSAVALRLFLLFIPFLLFMVGVAGLVGRWVQIDSPSGDAGITGTIAVEIDRAFDQSGSGPWFAVAIGLIGIATTGRSLTSALVVSSVMAWRVTERRRASVRLIGTMVGLIVATAFTSVLLNRIRGASGIGVVSISFLAVLGFYAALWFVLFVSLPKATTDPGAVLPGASLVASVLTGMQAFSQLYLPGQIERASSTYGDIGIAIATLGWLFILGRTIAFAGSINAVIFEEIGSVSRLLFALPGVRRIPARYPAVGRYFDLEGSADPITHKG